MSEEYIKQLEKRNEELQQKLNEVTEELCELNIYLKKYAMATTTFYSSSGTKSKIKWYQKILRFLRIKKYNKELINLKCNITWNGPPNIIISGNGGNGCNDHVTSGSGGSSGNNVCNITNGNSNNHSIISITIDNIKRPWYIIIYNKIKNYFK